MPATASPPAPAQHVVALPYGLHAPAVARRIAERWLKATEPADHVDDAVLVVSELVTNAVRHTHDSCRLTLTGEGGHLDIAVADHSEDLPDMPVHASGDERGGFGMDIVRQLGGQVTVVPAIGGKTVHVLLELES
ncbi:ATP-binding protein [Streptomyces phaeoluteigriseus]|uniref:ATP-binding protein n=1 Tax=Streptomyces phaeoluteigriseus TaxID=114686 RepID=A0ABY4ZAD0_9ACTN|nr:ATP-binding protein [Streptomyces phaeoluteigriseus]USQ85921.1 ATP-binding protein [Streptomyces phaeoluteigriseus]